MLEMGRARKGNVNALTIKLRTMDDLHQSTVNITKQNLDVSFLQAELPQI